MMESFLDIIGWWMVDYDDDDGGTRSIARV